MKNLKSKLLVLSFIVALITVLFNFNYKYWDEIGQIYWKNIKGELPKESDSKKLPPLPNPLANSNSILGIDSDSNGIRDDIDYWIAVNGLDYNERMAFREVAKLEQALLVAGIKMDASEFQEKMSELFLAEKCNFYIATATRGNYDYLISLISDLTTNTRLRKNTLHDIVKVRGYSYEPPPGVGPVASEEGYMFCKFKIINIAEVKRKRQIYFNYLTEQRKKYEK